MPPGPGGPGGTVGTPLSISFNSLVASRSVSISAPLRLIGRRRGLEDLISLINDAAGCLPLAWLGKPVIVRISVQSLEGHALGGHVERQGVSRWVMTTLWYWEPMAGRQALASRGFSRG